MLWHWRNLNRCDLSTFMADSTLIFFDLLPIVGSRFDINPYVLTQSTWNHFESLDSLCCSRQKQTNKQKEFTCIESTMGWCCVTCCVFPSRAWEVHKSLRFETKPRKCKGGGEGSGNRAVEMEWPLMSECCIFPFRNVNVVLISYVVHWCFSHFVF